MGKVVVTEFVSLDGVFEAPGGGEEYEHAGWTFEFDRGEAGHQFKLDELMAAEAQLLGRVTYEGFARAWPSVKDDFGFGDRMNSMPKYVVSKSLKSADWHNSAILNGDLFEQVGELKAKYAGDILVAGSGMLVDGLLDLGLVDELHLMTFPTILGSGRRLFESTRKRSPWKLIDTKQVGPDGVVVSIHRLHRPPVGQ